jgi:hypothetical protein
MGGKTGMEQAPFSSSEYVRLFFDLFEASANAVLIIRMSEGVVLDCQRVRPLAVGGQARVRP